MLVGLCLTFYPTTLFMVGHHFPTTIDLKPLLESGSVENALKWEVQMCNIPQEFYITLHDVYSWTIGRCRAPGLQ